MSQFIIYAYLFDGEGGASVLDEKALSAWTPEQGVLWVHLDYSHPETRPWLQKFSQRSDSALDDISVSALLAEDTRPRAAAPARCTRRRRASRARPTCHRRCEKA